MSGNKVLLILGCLLFVCGRAYAQADSVHVYLLATGLQGKELHVYYQGRPLLHVPAGEVHLVSAAIPVDPAWKPFTRLAFQMKTTRSWSSWSKDVSIPISLQPAPFRYLIIRRNAERKRNAPLDAYWSDQAPIMAM